MSKSRLLVASPSHSCTCTAASHRQEHGGGAGQWEPEVSLEGGHQEKLGRALLLLRHLYPLPLLAGLYGHFLTLWDGGSKQATSVILESLSTSSKSISTPSSLKRDK